MRSFVRRFIVLGTTGLAGLIWSGCEAKQVTEYVMGVSTQVQVPRDLKAVRIDISVNGVSQFCQGYKVYDGKVQLPRSLGSFAATESAVTSGPVTYTISGVTDGDVDAPFFAACAPPKVGTDSVRILRRSRQPYLKDEIRFLPLPLKYSCYDKSCGEEQTCKGGKCVSDTLNEDQARLAFPPYTPSLVDGNGGGCFSLQLCMGAAAPAITVDPVTCTYAVANTASAPPPIDPLADPFRPACATPAQCSSGVCNNGRCDALPPGLPWEGTNVEIVYDGGLNREVLDLDADEGFVYSDPAKPQQFKLAPGLCEMVKGVDSEGNPTAHRITAVRASGTCQPKRLAQPFCANDQLAQMGLNPDGTAPILDVPNDCSSVELKPPRSALIVVVDNTQAHNAFFNADQIKAVEFPLKDPAFERTNIGLIYAPVAGNCATNAPLTIGLEPALTVRQKLIDNFLQVAGNPAALLPGAPSYEGALASSYAALSSLSNTEFFKRAVVVVGNRDFGAEACNTLTGTPIEQATAARTTPTDPLKPINTYVIQLVKTDPTKRLDVQPPDPEADVLDPNLFALATAGSTAPPNPDARGAKKNAKDAFQQVINSLATCVYDVPNDSKAPQPEDTVSFSNPLFGTTVKVPPNAGCTGEGVPGNGWGYGTPPSASTKRIFLCNDACTSYRNTLAQASDFSLLYQQPPIPVPIFAHKKACEPK
jgi:hypothetical protein